jgi:hypothetical protein
MKTPTLNSKIQNRQMAAHLRRGAATDLLGQK